MAQRENLSVTLNVPMTPSMKAELERIAAENERKAPAEIRLLVQKHLARERAAA